MTPFITTRRIEFRDTDAAGIVHFSAFFPMMETAEHELLRAVGVPILPRDSASTSVTWPRVAATCQYVAAARFEDLLRIEVRVLKLGNSSIQYGFRFSKDPEGLQAANLDPFVCAEGSLTSVACRLLPHGLEKVPIPDFVRNSLTRYLVLGQ